MNLLKNAKIMEVLTADAAADDTDANSARLDMAGYEGVCFIVPITDSVTNGVATLTVEQCDSDTDTGMTAITSASARLTCTTSDDLNDKILVVDVYKPTKRYVQGVITSDVANIAFGNTIAIQYKGRKDPQTEAASAETTFVVGS
jgi:hypothetical protein